MMTEKNKNILFVTLLGLSLLVLEIISYKIFFKIEQLNAENIVTFMMILPLLLLVNFLFATYVLLLFFGKKTGISFFHPASLIATCFGVGKIPIASGTWGSIFAVILIFFTAQMPRYFFGFSANMMIIFFVIANIVIYFVGLKAAEIYMKKTKTHDPSAIVIDEVSGIFISVLTFATFFAIAYNLDAATFKPLLPLAIIYLFILFILFRIFDITKPWIIGRLDQRQDAHGVMLDDVVAGIFAGISCFLILITMLYSGLLGKLFCMFLPEWVAENGCVND